MNRNHVAFTICFLVGILGRGALGEAPSMANLHDSFLLSPHHIHSVSISSGLQEVRVVTFYVIALAENSSPVEISSEAGVIGTVEITETGQYTFAVNDIVHSLRFRHLGNKGTIEFLRLGAVEGPGDPSLALPNYDSLAAYLAAKAILLVDQLEPETDDGDYDQYLSPIRTQALLVYDDAGARPPLSGHVRKDVMELKETIDAASDFLVRSFGKKKKKTAPLATKLAGLGDKIDAVLK